MIVAGVMSGTSADGINVALVRITSSRSRAGTPGLHFLAHAEYPYPKHVRRAVLAAMNSTKANVANLARLNFLLAELYSDAVLAARVGVPVVSDFRPADMAAGGKGAPLVPFLDFLSYHDSRVGRIVQN